jgi:hypothetical protein
MRSLVIKLLNGRIGVWLKLYPVFAIDAEDKERILEMIQFQPNDVF